MVKTIVIDAGHGGHDAGAVGNGLKEKDLTLSIALATERYLKEHYTDHRIIQTRRTDKYLTLKQRTDIANRYNTSLFVSIHINSASATAHGYESFISPYTKSTGMLGQVHNNIRDYFRSLGIHNRGLKKMAFYVLRHTNAPAILTENLFISNPKEAAVLRKNIHEIAKAHAVGIAKALGLPQKKKEGGLTMSQYKELKEEIRLLQLKTREPLLEKTQQKDMKKLLKHAYNSGVFHVDHSEKVNKMTQKEAVDLMLSYVARSII